MNFHRVKNIRDIVDPPEHTILRVSKVSIGTIPSHSRECSTEIHVFKQDDIPEILQYLDECYKNFNQEKIQHVWFYERSHPRRFSLSYLLRQEPQNDTNFTHTLKFIEWKGIYYPIPVL